MDKPETDPAVGSRDLLGELWDHLKRVEQNCTESMQVALTPQIFDNIEGQRSMARELQHWLIVRGCSPNAPAQRPPTKDV